MKWLNSMVETCPNTGRFIGFKRPDFTKKLVFFIVGILSLAWFLIRVLPKPQRASYPCMKATMPIAYSFIAYLISLGGSVLFFRKAKDSFKARRYRFGIFIFLIASLLATWTLVMNNQSIKANDKSFKLFSDPLGANLPIGTAKGIFPGRVVWIFNPDATNVSCTNTSKATAYFQDVNCNQAVVDQMTSKSLKDLTGKDSEAEAWDVIFKYFNTNHGKGDVGYVAGEKIFIKINAVSAWSGAEPDGEMISNSIEFDTSPQSIMSILRQLVNVVGVPQDKIFVGDPMADIWNHLYNKFHAEFPNIKYVSKRTIPGRFIITADTTRAMYYSDKGAVMDDPNAINTCYYFKEMKEADYLINIPSMKGHRWAGVTFFAKNFFGANTADHSWELHKGLMKPDNDPLRTGYKNYRVQVDLMANKYLGGKTLLYFIDALWATSYEHQAPQKFQTAPFNNDWTSSIIASLDPVAIESVCLDILQKEFTVENLGVNPPRYLYCRFDGVDDYLHQAASSDYWPEGISYDPNNTGSPIGSLGVHEHWNNVNDMQYSRNLGTGEGIELLKTFETSSSIRRNTISDDLRVYPNPCSKSTNVSFNLDHPADICIEIISVKGEKMIIKEMGKMNSGLQKISVQLDNINPGIYFCVIKSVDNELVRNGTIKLVVN
jgi:hypothetical protein